MDTTYQNLETMIICLNHCDECRGTTQSVKITFMSAEVALMSLLVTLLSIEYLLKSHSRLFS
jgi:hypothetical protein